MRFVMSLDLLNVCNVNITDLFEFFTSHFTFETYYTYNPTFQFLNVNFISFVYLFFYRNKHIIIIVLTD